MNVKFAILSALAATAAPSVNGAAHAGCTKADLEAVCGTVVAGMGDVKLGSYDMGMTCSADCKATLTACKADESADAALVATYGQEMHGFKCDCLNKWEIDGKRCEPAEAGAAASEACCKWIISGSTRCTDPQDVNIDKWGETIPWMPWYKDWRNACIDQKAASLAPGACADDVYMGCGSLDITTIKAEADAEKLDFLQICSPDCQAQMGKGSSCALAKENGDSAVTTALSLLTGAGQVAGFFCRCAYKFQMVDGCPKENPSKDCCYKMIVNLGCTDYNDTVLDGSPILAGWKASRDACYAVMNDGTSDEPGNGADPTPAPAATPAAAAPAADSSATAATVGAAALGALALAF